MIAFTIREGVPLDRSYLIKSWLRSDARTQAARDCAQVYYRRHGVLVERLLDNSKVRIACLPDEPDAILGFCVTRQGTIHYTYVREGARRQGIAKALVRASLDGDPFTEPLTFTHRPSAYGLTLPSQWVFDPYEAHQ